MTEIIVIAHNIRSTHNVGSIFRTADGFGIKKILLTGYSPYPITKGDTRLPHIVQKISKDIHKTALGAEQSVPFEYIPEPPLEALRAEGYRLVALEQNDHSIPISSFPAYNKIALLLGEEVHGITKELLEQCDEIVEIPMVGQKESFNVSVATGIALYQLSGLAYNEI